MQNSHLVEPVEGNFNFEKKIKIGTLKKKHGKQH